MACCVTVSYLGLIRNVLGRREEEIEIAPGSTVGELLRQLAEKHGDPFVRTVFRNERELRSMTQVCLNDRDINELQQFDTPLSETGSVSIVVGVYPPEGG